MSNSESAAGSDGRVLECHDLRKAFGALTAIAGVGLHIDAGETYGLLGPNGAGKTTTISMIAGLLERDAGEVLVDGAPLTPTSVRVKASIGYVPQELAIYPDLTARENLRFFGRLYDLSGVEIRTRIEEILQVIGLTDRGDDLAKELVPN